MFGKNIKRKAELNDGLHLRVQSVFQTIQGEGPYAGRPCLFIRLNGCNLQCTFCDTDFESVELNRPILDLVFAATTATRGHRDKLVVLTGGEPLLQNVVPLIKALEVEQIETQIETAGSVWVPGLEETSAMLVCSPKTPTVHKMIQMHCEHWKYVVREGDSSAQDGLPIHTTQAGGDARRIAKLARPINPRAVIYVQPCEEYTHDTGVPVNDAVRTASNTGLASHLSMERGYRLSVQVHKIIGLP